MKTRIQRALTILLLAAALVLTVKPVRQQAARLDQKLDQVLTHRFPSLAALEIIWRVRRAAPRG
ncbi:MAG TPA: hypothetical protein VIC32_01930 [Terriglobales bacterium]